VNPDVIAAIPELVRRGILPADRAAVVLRAARGDLLSVRDELRILLYGGVILIATGVGLLVRQNLERIGPVTIAVAIALAATGCLAWVVFTARPFSWAEQASPNLAFDYILLLGALLVAVDLAYVEVSFTPLGSSWPWHLLLVSLFYAGLAVRYDSRLLFSLALSTFAAWRGVAATSFVTWSWVESSALSVRLNAIACGALFVILGALLLKARRKPHFEPVATHLGWLLVLAGLASGVVRSGSAGEAWALYSFVLLAVAATLGALAFRSRRFSLFGMAIVAGYIAFVRPVLAVVRSDELAALFLAASAAALVLGLVRAHGAMKESG